MVKAEIGYCIKRLDRSPDCSCLELAELEQFFRREVRPVVPTSIRAWLFCVSKAMVRMFQVPFMTHLAMWRVRWR